MKKLILFELIILFLATTFESDSPPGWFQQTLPVNDQINDIFFIDSLTGWVVTDGRTSTNDTGYIMKTTNGGNNWVVQYNQPMKLNAVQFLDASTGYVVGGSGSGTGRIFKTTNGGTNWNNINTFSTLFHNLHFINKDTGWVADPQGFGGLYKTTNGGGNWMLQMSDTGSPKNIFMLNKDTGWVGNNNITGKLYRTTNGGFNWVLYYTFGQQINDMYFFNRDTGVVSSGFSYKTTNGGNNWTQVNDGGIKLSFVNNNTGWAGSNFNRIMKTVDGGSNWYRQSSPIFDNSSTFGIDTSKAWAGGTGLVRTSDGGGPFVGVTQISSEVPLEYKLYQNYPNPFNPVTNIKYQTTKNNSGVKISVFDVTGRHVIDLVNQKHSAGTYEADWNASGFPSGIYFYSLIIDGKIINTKRMVLIK